MENVAITQQYADLADAARSFSPEGITVALLAGGTSEEREISRSSGNGAEAALKEAGFDVRRYDPAVPEDMAALQSAAAARDVQVAFLCLHGKGGEDGTIQKTLEDMGLPYTGSGVEASRIAIDKNIAKCAYKREKLPTAPWVYLEQEVYRTAQERGVADMVLKKITELLGDHTVVKAVEQGSTQGLYMSKTPSDLGKYIEDAFAFDNAVVVEQYIEGEEYTVAVVGNDNPRALPVIKLALPGEFYDFEAKYAPGGAVHLCPAPAPEELTARLSELAVLAHRAIGCRGMSRTDFIVDADGEPWILETNTIPGMTKTSLLPDAARVAGLSFAELCTLLVKWALE